MSQATYLTISALLVRSLLLAEHRATGRIDLSAFYVRRALRLLPALLLLLLVVGIGTLFFVHGQDAVTNWFGIASSLLYVGNWSRLVFPIVPTLQGFHGTLGVLNHTWSLAVEEQFYLFWPLLLIAALRFIPRPKVTMSLTALLILLLFLWRRQLFIWLSPQMAAGIAAASLRISGGTDTRLDQLLVGCLLAMTLHFGLIRSSPSIARFTRILLIPGLAWLGWVFYANMTYMQAWLYGGSTLLAIVVALVILLVLSSLQGHIAHMLSWRPLVQLGIVLYGVYLWHYVVFSTLPPDGRDWLDCKRRHFD